MKILLINWQDPANPQAGGAETHLQEIFTRISAGGHSVTWLASGWPGAPRRGRLDGIELHRAGSRYSFGPASVAYYLRHLRPQRHDVVVEALNKVPVYAPIWCRSPVILLVHHLFGSTAFQEAAVPLAIATWLQERPLRRVYGRVPVQAISHSTAHDLEGRGLDPESITVIHPGVDLDFFRPASSPTRTVTPTFLYLGRLRRYKRIDLILKAFARLLRDRRPARLIIAGKGDAEDELRRLSARLGLDAEVEFVGFVTEEEKRDLFRSSWANVFTSPKEGWGITNLEAAACATPTIASDSPGLRESVVNGRTGMLVPHGEVQALALAMLRLASEPRLVEDLGLAARAFARGFTWERTARATEVHLHDSLRLGMGGAS